MTEALKLANADSVLERKYARFVGDPAEIISRSNVIIDKPTAEWLDGMHLGNGDLGAMVYGPPENMTYCLSKNDIWDLRYVKDETGLTLEKLKKILKAKDKKAYNKYRDYYLRGPQRRDFPAPKPAGLLRLHLCEGANAGYYRQKLDIYNAQCSHLSAMG